MVVEIENNPWKKMLSWCWIICWIMIHTPSWSQPQSKKHWFFGVDLSLETRFPSCHRGAPIHHPRNMDDHDLETMVMTGYPMTQETPIQGNMLLFPSHSCGENRLVPLFCFLHGKIQRFARILTWHVYVPQFAQIFWPNAGVFVGGVRMKSPGASDCLGVSLSAPRWNGNGGSWFQWGKKLGSRTT